MQQNNNEITFTEKENKLISAASRAESLAFLLQLTINFLIINQTGRIWFFSYIAAVVLFTVSVLFYAVLFIIGLRKIKPYLFQYIVMLTILVLMLAMDGYLSLDHFSDVFNGSKKITTAEYSLNSDNVLMLSDGSRIIHMDLPKDTASQLDKLDIAIKSEFPLHNSYLLIHPNTITVEYYENTEVFLSVEINE